MTDKIRAAFLLLVALQALHSAEEFIFHFYEVFPPMVLLYRSAPHLARPAFAVANVFLVAAGVACWFYWVRPARRGARAVVWAWVGGEAFNVVAHCAWAVMIGGYNPGLATGLGFVPALVYLSYRLRHDPRRADA